MSIQNAGSQTDKIVGNLRALGEQASSSIPTSPEMEKNLILNSLGDRPLVREIQAGIRDTYFHPDVTGYVAFILIPPDLSGYADTTSSPPEDTKSIVVNACKSTPILSLDFTPPDTVSNTSEISNNSGVNVKHFSGKQSGGQFSVSYIEDKDLTIQTLHNLWIYYMMDVTRGYVDPDPKYIDGDEAFAMDYVTSAFVAKYNPTCENEIYIGKISGLIPTNLSSKELLGSRQDNQLTMINMNYTCAEYMEVTITDTHIISQDHHYKVIIEEYIDLLETWYSGEVLKDLFQNIRSALRS